MVSQMLLVPANNMFAEKTLGLVHYYFRNAHYVKIVCVDAKVNSKTLPLCTRPQNVQGKIILKNYAQKIKLLIHTNEYNIAREQEKKT